MFKNVPVSPFKTILQRGIIRPGCDGSYGGKSTFPERGIYEKS